MEGSSIPQTSEVPPAPVPPQAPVQRKLVAIGVAVVLIAASVVVGIAIEKYVIQPGSGGHVHLYPDNETFTKTYTWEFGVHSYSIHLNITAGEYYQYKDRSVSRSPATDDSATMAQYVTPSDPIVERLGATLEGMAQNRSFSNEQTMNFMLAFVQNIGYSYDNQSTGQEDYWRYSVETLFDHTGDCEDLSILYSSLLESTGHDAVLLLFVLQGHAAVGAACPGATGTYFLYDSVHYYYCETTAPGWRLGEEPQEMQAGLATIVQVP